MHFAEIVELHARTHSWWEVLCLTSLAFSKQKRELGENLFVSGTVCGAGVGRKGPSLVGL